MLQLLNYKFIILFVKEYKENNDLSDIPTFLSHTAITLPAKIGEQTFFLIYYQYPQYLQNFPILIYLFGNY